MSRLKLQVRDYLDGALADGEVDEMLAGLARQVLDATRPLPGAPALVAPPGQPADAVAAGIVEEELDRVARLVSPVELDRLCDQLALVLGGMPPREPDTLGPLRRPDYTATMRRRDLLADDHPAFKRAAEQAEDLDLDLDGVGAKDAPIAKLEGEEDRLGALDAELGEGTAGGAALDDLGAFSEVSAPMAAEPEGMMMLGGPPADAVTLGTPQTPGTPGTPQTPGTPGTPQTPGTPGTPQTPGLAVSFLEDRLEAPAKDGVQAAPAEPPADQGFARAKGAPTGDDVTVAGFVLPPEPPPPSPAARPSPAAFAAQPASPAPAIGGAPPPGGPMPPPRSPIPEAARARSAKQSMRASPPPATLMSELGPDAAPPSGAAAHPDTLTGASIAPPIPRSAGAIARSAPSAPTAAPMQSASANLPARPMSISPAFGVVVDGAVPVALVLLLARAVFLLVRSGTPVLGGVAWLAAAIAYAGRAERLRDDPEHRTGAGGSAVGALASFMLFLLSLAK